VTALNCRFMLMSIFNSTVQSVPCPSNNMRQARQCRHLNNDQSQQFVGTYLHLAVWLQGETSDQDITEPVSDWTLMHIHWKIKKFLLRVTVSLAMA